MRQKVVLILFLVVSFIFPGAVMSQSLSEKYPGRVRAVEFPKKDWLNTQKPLTLAELKGKVVILDFWTYCCINCMHVLPDLEKIEKRFPKDVVVVGVHSAKFENERVTDNIRAAILRYEIEHPVINDDEMILWDQYGVRAWPTLVVIDPQGYVIGAIPGEGNYEILEKVVSALIADHKKEGTLKPSEFQNLLEKTKIKTPGLFFPGKIVTRSDASEFFVSDSNHNRIVSFDANGRVINVIGSGEEAWRDGSFSEAAFDHPQGMALDGDALYVADTENHLIRKIDLKAKTVRTIAGTGKQVYNYTPKGDPLLNDLNSPWDLYLHKGWLYIAMAGPHQIWAIDLAKNQIYRFAGTGRENIQDGLHGTANFAQPSGLTSDGKTLFVADSEVSAVRAVDLDINTARVRTLVGQGLFDFGDVDGVGDLARLQHALGVAYYDGKVYVADTYNHKIKILDPQTRQLTSFAGSGKPGLKDGVGKEAQFFEPSGLTVAAGKLYVTDTNNHKIRVVDLKDARVTTLELQGLDEAPKTSSSAAASQPPLAAKVRSLAQVKFVVDLKLPAHVGVNDMAPQELVIDAKDVVLPKKSFKLAYSGTRAEVPVSIPAKGRVSLEARVTAYLCTKDAQKLCFFKKLVWPVEVVEDPAAAGNEIVLKAEIKE